MVNDVILTPVTIWKNFVADCSFQESFISELTCDGIAFKNIYFSGRDVGGERVRIFATLAQSIISPSDKFIVLVDDPSEGFLLERIKFFASLGYSVICPDLGGIADSAHFTKYPKSVDYANYQNCKDDLTKITSSVINTPWYEWACVVRYTVLFAKSNLSANNISLVGVHNGSNICFMSITDDVSCFVSIFGAFIPNKFSKDVDAGVNQILSDEGRKFFAGLQAESYCKFITCPVLYLSATNNQKFDLLKATEALNHLEGDVYYYYSPRMRRYLLKTGLSLFEKFLNKYLNKKNIHMYSPPELSVSVKDGKIYLDAKFDKKSDLEYVKLYTSSGDVPSFKKNWDRVSHETKKQYVLEEKDYNDKISAYLMACYKDGTSVCSPVVTKKVKSVEVKGIPPLYSEATGNTFASLNAYGEVLAGLFLHEEKNVDILSGPFNIKGAYSPSGLITFNVCEHSALLNASTMIKFDLYCQNYSVFTIGLLVEDNGVVVQYEKVLKINGGSVWQRGCEELNDFKTKEGKSLKNFKGVFALTFYSEDKFLINNLILF